MHTMEWQLDKYAGIPEPQTPAVCTAKGLSRIATQSVGTDVAGASHRCVMKATNPDIAFYKQFMHVSLVAIAVSETLRGVSVSFLTRCPGLHWQSCAS